MYEAHKILSSNYLYVFLLLLLDILNIPLNKLNVLQNFLFSKKILECNHGFFNFLLNFVREKSLKISR